jgi:hypothetical protein
MVKISSLRMPLTNITHSYLMDGEVEEGPPECLVCHVATLTVNHVMTDRLQLTQERLHFFGNPNPNLNETLGNGKILQIYSITWNTPVYPIYCDVKLEAIVLLLK